MVDDCSRRIRLMTKQRSFFINCFSSLANENDSKRKPHSPIRDLHRKPAFWFPTPDCFHSLVSRSRLLLTPVTALVLMFTDKPIALRTMLQLLHIPHICHPLLSGVSATVGGYFVR